jgi:predicted ATPase/transcriptional regulator with XRE-family HTH domain
MDTPSSFGAWLRRRRKALDHTQAELAHMVGCAVGTIKSIEADARRPSRQLAERLATALALTSDERVLFLKAARGLLIADQLVTQPDGTSHVEPVVTMHQPCRVAFPSPLNMLIGRDRELAELEAMLADPGCRLITIIGPGGIGKTRLALAAAEQAVGYRDGAVFVALAAINSPLSIAPAILNALGVPLHSEREPQAQLRDVLRHLTLLLVLDNLEQLLVPTEHEQYMAAALLAELLAYAPDLHVLATSRERLGVPGEWLYDLGGLAVPQDATRLAIEHSSAGQLFLQRARQTRHQFVLTDKEAHAAAHVCSLVEGMPLAIELAAAGLRSRSITAIAEALETGVTALATGLRGLPERHRSILAAFEQSWLLLSDEERHVFARLSVSRGGFEQAASAHIAQASPQLLAALVDKSLLRWDGNGRYTIHELLRQYGSEKLAELGETEQAGSQHLAYYCTLAEQLEPELYGPQHATARELLDTELGNLRAALAWSLEHNIQVGLRLADALDRYWNIYRPLQEGIGWLRQLLSHPDAAPPNLVRAKALLTLGGLLDSIGPAVEARSLAEEGLVIYRAVGDKAGIAQALLLLGILAEFLEGRSADIPFVTQSLEYAREIGDQRTMAVALGWLGGATYREHHDYIQAREYYHTALAHLRELGDNITMIWLLNDLAWIALSQRDFAQAHACVHEAQELSNGLGIGGDTAANIGAIRGQLALREGQYAEARSIFEECLRLNQASGNGIDHWTTANLGYAVLRLGDLERAYALFAKTINEFQYGTQTIGVAFAIEGMASLAVVLGQAERAVRLYAWADTLRVEILDERPPIEQDDVDRDFAIIRTLIDDVTIAAAKVTGCTMTMEQAIADAIMLLPTCR